MSTTKPTERPIESVVLNAVHATVTGRDGVFENEASRQRIQRVYEATTTPDVRRRFEQAIEQETTEMSEEADEVVETQDVVGTVVESVCNELASDEAHVQVDHRTKVTIPPREATLYTYGRTQDSSILDGLSLPETIEADVRTGAKHVDNQEYAAAASAFEDAVDASDGQDGSVSTRVLAAWARHWNGDDEDAIDLVDEALYFHVDAWTPRLAGYAADHQFPEQFRSGKLGACALLRQTVDVPEDCSVDAALGFSDEDSEEIEWHPLAGTDDCMPTDRLESETHVRLRLRGAVPDFPALHGYHLSLGVVDFEVNEVRNIYRMLLSGPEIAGASETIAVEM